MSNAHGTITYDNRRDLGMKPYNALGETNSLPTAVYKAASNCESGALAHTKVSGKKKSMNMRLTLPGPHETVNNRMNM